MPPQNEPNLMRLYARHCAIGFGLSAVFTALLLWFDVAGLGGLVARADVGLLAVFLLWFFHGTIFGSVQFALMVMNMQEPEDRTGPGGGSRQALVPQRQEARRRL